jgi:hypothetical protein
VALQVYVALPTATAGHVKPVMAAMLAGVVLGHTYPPKPLVAV